MSPERLFEEDISLNADSWSVGIISYEMLCGQFPFGIKEGMSPGRTLSLI